MPKPTTILAAATTWLASALVYLVFAPDTNWREWIAAAICAALAAAAVIVFAVVGRVHIHLRLHDVLQLYRLPKYILTGTVQDLQSLAKQLFSHNGAASVIAAVPFDVGTLEDPAEAGRRALAVSYPTATPNFIVLGPVDEQQLLLYHQVFPGKVLPLLQQMGART